MLKEDGRILYGEWLPDRPFLDNPGLVEAQNVIPVDGYYKDMLAIAGQGDTLGARPQGAFAAIDSAGDSEIYVGTATNLYEKTGSSFNSLSSTTFNTATNGYWRFCQFDDLVIATNYNDSIRFKTVGSASTMGALSADAPKARQIGVIGRFVVVGDTSDTANGAVPSRVEWAAIDNPLNWPDPGTSTARAVQSGEQFLNSGYGAVTGIANGQFYGLVFQQRAVNRFTYVGGDSVWQVQEIDSTRGCWAPQSLIQVGGLSYFLASDGFYVTNGQTVTPIGNSKVDKWFYSYFDQGYRERVTAAFDYTNKCIFWVFPSTTASSGSPDRVIVYNINEGRWSWGEQAIQLLFQSYTTGYTLDQLDSLYTSIDDMSVTLDSSSWQGGAPAIHGFTGNQFATFAGSPLTATLDTSESDVNPFGRIFIRGVRPLVTGNPTGLTVAISSRENQDNESMSFGTAVSRTSRTGVCDFREQARFIAFRTSIAGGFDRAIGIALDFEAGDQV